jgi:hypothetical protein
MKLGSALPAAILLSLAPLTASAATIQNAAFGVGLLNTTGVTQFDTGWGYENPSGWTINGRQVRYQVDGVGNYWVVGDVVRAVDLSIYPSKKAEFQLDGMTVGQSYVMTFYINRASADTATSRIDISAGSSLKSYNMGSYAALSPTAATFTFTAKSASTILTFASFMGSSTPTSPTPTSPTPRPGGGLNGPFDLSLPEPSSYLLFGSGLTALAVYARRRKRS